MADAVDVSVLLLDCDTAYIVVHVIVYWYLLHTCRYLFAAHLHMLGGIADITENVLPACLGTG